MNIMITDFCNLNCEYCFAKSEMINKSEISLENFNKVLLFLKNSNELAVNLIGGEPTLHSNFECILKQIKENGFKAINVYTNGVFNQNILDLICKYNKTIPINLVINLNSPKKIGHKIYNQIINNIKELQKNNVSIVLGKNIFLSDLDFTYFFDAIREFQVNKIRWSVVVPIKHPDDSIEYYKSYVEYVIGFLEKCHELGCETYCDCNRIPACAFEDAQIRRLIYLQPDYFTSHKCTPVLDVDVNLNVFRCFGTSDLAKVNLTDFPNTTILAAFFMTAIDKKIDKQNSTFCQSCNLSNCCRGGCIFVNKGRCRNVQNC